MKDYIIVGFGLAGMAIAEELRNRDKSFVVITDQSQKASEVAGGVMNPLILKRFTKTWNAEEFIPKAIRFYKKIENFLSNDFFHSVPIYRRFTSFKEQNDWFFAADKPHLSEFLDSELYDFDNLVSDFKFGKVNQTSVLKADKLLKTYRDFLDANDKLIAETFHYHALEFKSDGVEYKNIQAKKIIFCEGFGMLENPWFKTLPLRGNKGEYLIIKAPELKLDVIIKSGVFLIPLGNDFYKVGSTYERQFTNQVPQEKTRQVLIRKLESVIDCPYEITDQIVGIRPTVKDRYPLLGKHPEHKNVLICNGFGSHGVMIAPTAAKWLLDYSENGKPLPKEVDIARFN